MSSKSFAVYEKDVGITIRKVIHRVRVVVGMNRDDLMWAMDKVPNNAKLVTSYNVEDCENMYPYESVKFSELVFEETINS